MDTEIDLQEAYSIETKTKKVVFKLPEGPKKLAFFSKVGKSRLLRICQDNNLDDEILFTGWVGPSDAFVREQVSDHVQHYLFKRARRLSMDRRIAANGIAPKTDIPEKGKKFIDYENYVKRQNEAADESRADQEAHRIRKLLISGETKTAPDGFEYIANDPIYKVNRLCESVRSLGAAKIKQNSHPFDLRNLNPIKNLNDKTEKPNDEVQDSIDCIGDSTANIFTPKSSLSDFESESSGFQEITPSPTKAGDFTQSPFSNGGYVLDFPSDNVHDPDPSLHSLTGLPSDSEVSDDDNDGELSCAEEHSAFEDISGDLEIDLNIISVKSEPIELIINQHTCSNLYKTGSDVVDMYLRQQVAGMEFMESFSSRFFGKQQAT